MSTPDLSEPYMRYFAARQQQRRDDFTAAVGRLTAREYALVREAAVMGFVQGHRAAGGGNREDIPPDLEILYRVVTDAEAMNDLYPTLAALYDEPELPSA